MAFDSDHLQEIWLLFLVERSGLSKKDVMLVLDANDLFWETHPDLFLQVCEEIENE